MKCVLTGGAGFIGCHLARRLLADGHEVVLLDNFHRNALQYAPDLKESGRVQCLTGDVLQPEKWSAALRGADLVVHMAAIAGVSSYYSRSLETLKVNIVGSLNTLEAAAAAGVPRFIDFSTSEVFGERALWVREEDPCRIGPPSDRRWVYATSKVASEHLALRIGETSGMNVTVVRPFNVYGPLQVGEGAISNFCRAIVEQKPLQVYGDGSPLRAWCFISDFIEALMAILERPEATRGEVFHIGNPSEVESTLGLARRFQALVPGAVVERKDVVRAEIKARIPCIDKARERLGYEPRISLEEGLRRTLDWYRREFRP